jgi:type II secretory ATPase GspE/PulE/Tfp pilus assembly ATPase PilB-like protein
MTAPINSPFAHINFESTAADETIRQVLLAAGRMGATDVLLMSQDGHVRMAVRHLGVIRRFEHVPFVQGRRLLTALKTWASMNIGEHRQPQDGRWSMIDTEGGGQKLDVRVNVLPTLFGEDANLRLLYRDSQLRSMDQLGLLKVQRQQIEGMLASPSGLILVTGPAGSGKTTTLYACIHHLNEEFRTISTIEDPIEYALPGIRQSQVNEKIGVDFPDLLRAVLRQTPDVIMIGEIRDARTAATAVRAANSGHFVLATVHAPVAAAAAQSLLAFGIEPYFLATGLQGVIAQRLVRTLDPETRIPYDLSLAPASFDELKPWLAPGEGDVMYGPGESTPISPDGYSGQSGVFEILLNSPGLRDVILQRRSAAEIQQRAIDEGMLDFRRAALIKIAQGVTSTEEVLRAVPVDFGRSET